MANPNGLLGATILTITALSLSACAANPGPVMSKSTDKLISYFEAKQELADTLQMQLGGPTANSPRNEYYSYRLVAINGPAYELGSVLAVSNKLDLITRKCTLPNDLVPVEQWASMPRWTSNSTLSTDLGIPAPFQGVFQKAKTSLDADLNFQSASIYQIEDIGQRFLARDEMDTFIARGDCGEYLSTLSEPVVFVRGIIYGRETLKSAKGFGGGIDLRVVEEESGQLRFKYDNTGAYELSDASVMPKFAIMAKIMPASVIAQGAVDTERGTPGTVDPERVAQMRCELTAICGDIAGDEERGPGETIAGQESRAGLMGSADIRAARRARTPSRSTASRANRTRRVTSSANSRGLTAPPNSERTGAATGPEDRISDVINEDLESANSADSMVGRVALILAPLSDDEVEQIQRAAPQ